MAKLTPESPRLFRPTLAAWIGLNESIFLEQLNFILTEVENKGKFADGKKWYRDTPRAFMIQYFPFWDESIVKRTIANLRADALILARSDLNDDPKDRSLWYTINYPTLERLDRPVARITGKVAKRKEARQARKTGQDSNIEYTKVQNVLLPEVQSVPRVQNVPTPQVQNVPTPKESSFPKDSKPKEKTPLKGGGKPPITKHPELSRQMFTALAKVCKIDLTVLTSKTRGELNQNECALRNGDVIPADLSALEIWWYDHDWRGKQDQPPTPKQVIDVLGQFRDWRGKQAERAKGWESPPDPIPKPPKPEHVTVWEAVKPMVRDQMTRQTFDTLFKDAEPIARENGTFELRVKASALEMIAARPRVRANVLTAIQAVKPEIHDLDFKELTL